MKAILTISQKSPSDFIQALAWTQVSPFERQGFPPAGKSLPVLTTLSSIFSRGTMPALFRMAFCGIFQYPCQIFKNKIRRTPDKKKMR
jgi:hypothetical protein